jgi:ATP-binding cassette subfamily B protein
VDQAVQQPEQTEPEEQPEQSEGRLRDNILGGLRLSWEASPREFVTLVVLAIVSAVLPPLMVWLGARLVDQVARAFTHHVPLSSFAPLIVALGVVTALENALGSIRYQRQDLFTWKVELQATKRFLEQAADVDVGHFDDSGWHDRMARAKRDVSWRPSQLTWSVIGLGSSGVTVLGMLGLLLTLHPVLVVLSLASVLPGVLIGRKINRQMYEFWFANTPRDRERDYIKDLLTGTATAREVRAFGLGPHFLGRHKRIVDGQYERLRSLYARAGHLALNSSLITGVALASAYAFVAARGSNGQLNVGDLAAVIGAFAGVRSQVSLISQSLLSIDQHAKFLDDYFTFLKVEPLVNIATRTVPLPSRLEQGIVFDDVHFSYPRVDGEALSGVNLEVRPGELVAFVGDNGAGKTTLVKLLMRFYDATAGSVRIGGVDLRDADPNELRARMGALFQDFTNYQLTLRENVTLGRVDRASDDLDVVAALESARAGYLVKKLPKGLGSNVGRLFEGGQDLSGGEWQRLALARLIHREADIWILDEPTSNLDPEAEAAIFSELKEQLHGRMGIVISHRFSTVRVADRIYVIGDGRVLESGSHDELMSHGGRYSELFELQAAGYR